MNDLIVRLKLNSNQWDTNLKKSQQQIQGFSKTANSSFGGLGNILGKTGGLITKFAGGLGLAVSAVEVLNKGINSTSSTQNLYNDAIGTATKVTDDFFQSLITGDWTKFNGGMLNAIDNAKTFVQSQREIQATLAVTQTMLDRFAGKQSRYESVFEDESRPLNERQTAYNQFRDEATKTFMQVDRNLSITNSKLDKMIATDAGSNRYVNSQNAQDIILDLSVPESSLNSILNTYQELKNLAQTRINTNVFQYSGDEEYRKQQEQSRKFYQTYSTQQRQEYDELLRLRETLTEDRRNEYNDLFQQAATLNEQTGQLKKDMADAATTMKEATESANNAGNTLINAGSSLSKGANDLSNSSVVISGSINELKKQIANLEEDWANAANDGMRRAINEQIKNAQTQLDMMIQRSKGTELLSSNDLIGNVPVWRNPTTDIYNGSIGSIGVVNPFTNDDIELNSEYADSLNNIATVMGSITNVVNEGAASWLSYGTNIMTTVANAIPSIVSLTTALQAKAAAEAAGSAASIPVTGWITAIAAIGSIMAAFAAIPKFATGGIIGGNSFIGDKVLARVNSGEMILNNQQQSRLFNILNGEYSKGNITNNQVEFRIQGKELVGVLNSYNNKVSKYR